MREIRVWSLGWEDTLEKEMATHSSIRAWEIPWTEEPGGLQSVSHKESDMTEHERACICTHRADSLHCTAELHTTL